MIKYTILYKNGKTWNGKATHLRNILCVDCHIMVATYPYMTNSVRTDVLVPSELLPSCLGWVLKHFSINKVETKKVRQPNPKSKTKKQKAFDEAYRKWGYDMGELNDGKRGNLDFSIKAYKKWLYEQKQEDNHLTEVVGALPEYKVALYTNADEPKKITFPSGASVSFHDSKDVLKGCKECYVSHEPWDGVYKPWKEAKLSIPDYPLPIKTTYSFWLGAFGEVADV